MTTTDEFRSACSESTKISQIAIRLGLGEGSGNYDRIRKAILDQSLDYGHIEGFIRNSKYTDQDLLDSIPLLEEGLPLIELAVRFGYSRKSMTARTSIQNDLLRLGYQVAQSHPNGSEQPLGPNHLPLHQILVKGTNYKGSVLKTILLREGLLKYKCACCDIFRWNDQELALQLDHVNGDRYDNRRTNLRLLCPNCHSQCPTYAAGNRNPTDWSCDNIKRIASISSTISDMTNHLGLGGQSRDARDKLKYIAKYYSIDIPHRACQRTRTVVNDMLTKNSRYKSSRVKLALFSSGKKKPKCSQCEIIDWRDKPLMFVLDHINGINDDNRIGNLRVLCFNCDSQTSTYRGRNRGKSTGIAKQPNRRPSKRVVLNRNP